MTCGALVRTYNIFGLTCGTAASKQGAMSPIFHINVLTLNTTRTSRNQKGPGLSGKSQIPNSKQRFWEERDQASGMVLRSMFSPNKRCASAPLSKRPINSKGRGQAKKTLYFFLFMIYFDLAIRKPILLHLLAGTHEKRALTRSSREKLDHRPPLATRSEPIVLMGFDFSSFSYPPM
jgi:hypothetical protein